MGSSPRTLRLGLHCSVALGEDGQVYLNAVGSSNGPSYG
jgi:hypothetical protein